MDRKLLDLLCSPDTRQPLALLESRGLDALNRAIAVAELDGPQVGLALIDTDPLVGYHAWHAARADMLRRLGRRSEAREEYDAAMNATENRAERAFLTRRRDQTGTS